MNTHTLEPLDNFTRAYIECALWSSLDNATASGGYPLDQNFSAIDISHETMAKIVKDCAQFQEANQADLDASDLSLDRQGHNFWLNRNGHGSGFWDEWMDDSPEHEACMRLSRACKSFGEFSLFVGDDGMIWGD